MGSTGLREQGCVSGTKHLLRNVCRRSSRTGSGSSAPSCKAQQRLAARGTGARAARVSALTDSQSDECHLDEQRQPTQHVHEPHGAPRAAGTGLRGPTPATLSGRCRAVPAPRTPRGEGRSAAAPAPPPRPRAPLTGSEDPNRAAPCSERLHTAQVDWEQSWLKPAPHGPRSYFFGRGRLLYLRSHTRKPHSPESQVPLNGHLQP